MRSCRQFCAPAVVLLGLLVLLVLLVPLGCSSLPVIVPDLARRPGPAVQLEGSRGTLSAAQSKAILGQLSRSGQPTDIFLRHLAVEDALVGNPLTTGNRVVLLQDGPATYQGHAGSHPGGAGAHPHGNLHPGG